MTSLRTQLTLFWILLLAACGALAVTMTVLYRSSVGAQVAASRTITETACRTLATRQARSVQSDPAAAGRIDLMQVLLHLVLVETPQVEGGVWRVGDGNLAYAYPTYEGSGEKRDLPAAEQPLIEELATQAAREGALRTDVVRGSREAVVLTACPLMSAQQPMAAWTMTRVSGNALAAQGTLRVGLGALLLLVLGSAAWLGWLLAKGLRHVSDLQRQLSQADANDANDAHDTSDTIDTSHTNDGARTGSMNRLHATPQATMPALRTTGVQELDRIVDGFNRFRDRFNAAQARIREADRQRGRDLRLATLGRMTGAIAHEIRNPIAAMRLKAENALAGPTERQGDALRSIVSQVDRLDSLVKSLLGLVQPLQLQVQDVALRPWLEQRLAAVQSPSPALQLRLDVSQLPQPDAACGTPANTSLQPQSQPQPDPQFDPLHMARAIDNLLDNAVRHAPPDGQVTLRALRTAQGALLLQVDDNGEGVPSSLVPTLFEPFATGRADGTGLGLALAREVAFAHGGDLRHVSLAPTEATPAAADLGAPGATSAVPAESATPAAIRSGTRFELEIPWRAS